MHNDSTAAQYNYSLNRFVLANGHLPCTSDVVLEYIKENCAINREDRLKVSAMKAHLAAISRWHTEDDWDDPTKSAKIKNALRKFKSLERQNGIRKSSSRFVTTEEVGRIVNVLRTMRDTKKGRRDGLMMALAITCGPRAGMLASIKVEELINLSLPGMQIIIDTPAFKTDEEIPTFVPFSGLDFCPASWLRGYIQECEIQSGYVFRAMKKDYNKPLSRHSINSILREILNSAGVNVGKLTSHTFRKSMATIAAMEGVNVVDIAAQGSWGSIDTVNKDYISKSIALQGKAAKAVMNAVILEADKQSGANPIVRVDMPDMIPGLLNLSETQCLQLLSNLSDRLGIETIKSITESELTEDRGISHRLNLLKEPLS
jgi:integrase